MPLLIYIWVVFLWGATPGACGILVPQPGIKPRPVAVRAQSPNQWTAREFPWVVLF